MKEYDELIKARLEIRNSDLSQQMIDVDQWNRLSVTDIDEDFVTEINRVIDD